MVKWFLTKRLNECLRRRERELTLKIIRITPNNYIVCSQCKTKNPGKAIYCVTCGSKLDRNLNIKCTSCGTENTANAKFCVGCGKKLDQTIKSEQIKVKPKIQPAMDKVNDVKFSESKNESESINTNTLETKDEPNTNPIIPSNIPEHDLISKYDSKKICPACNGKNLKTAKFCVVCGKNFDKIDTSSDIPEQTEEKTKSQSITPEIKVPKGIFNTNKKYETKKRIKQRS